MPWMGKSTKHRRATRVVYYCRACRQTADTAKRMRDLRCTLGHGSSARAGFLRRLRETVNQDHPQELLRAARLCSRVFPRHAVRDQCVCEASVNLPMACMRQHEALVLAWPEPHRGGYTYALRFICRLCCAHATSRFNLLSRSCGPVVRGAARLRRHLQTACDSPDVVAKRTAEFALHVLGDALPAAPLAPPPPPTVTSLADMCADGLQYPAVPLGLANRTAASSSGLAGTESGAFLSLRPTCLHGAQAA